MEKREVSGAGVWSVEAGVNGRVGEIRLEQAVRVRPRTRAQLHAWMELALGIRVPTRAVMRDGGTEAGVSTAPFEYLAHTYFEGTKPARWGRKGGAETASGIRQQAFVKKENGEGEGESAGEIARAADVVKAHEVSADCVVWAARGTGKTFLGAVATLLDLVFKPGVQIKILGGSLEQSRRMHEHLCRLFERPGLAVLVDGEITARRVRLLNGSCAEVLAASQTSVRGSRVQKVRCDEVELFDPDLWRAVQLTTRSAPIAGPWGETVRGAVEALSTMHEPGGLMARVVEDARGTRRIFRWGVLDVLAKCDERYECASCTLRTECAGRVKERDKAGEVPGFVSVEDALRLRSRVDQGTWESEMLCMRPRRASAVYEEFDEKTHVVACETNREEEHGQGDEKRKENGNGAVRMPANCAGLRWIAGMDFGIRSETAIVLASVDRDGVLRIEREHVRAGWRLEEHVEVLRDWDRALRGQGVGAAGVPCAGIEWVAIDPAGLQRNDQTGINNATVLRQAGLVVRAGRAGVMEGVRMVKARLGGGPVSPRVFVRETCAGLIAAMKAYRFNAARLDRLEPVKDGHDHVCDALRYLVVSLDGSGLGPPRISMY